MAKNRTFAKLAALLAAVALAAAALTGCASTSKPYFNYRPDKSHTEQPSQPGSTPVESPAPAPDTIPETPSDPEPEPGPSSSGAASSEPEPEIPSQPMESLEAVAGLGDLVGNYSQFPLRECTTMDIDHDHNPYDLTWRYGSPSAGDGLTANKRAKLILSPEWSALYDSYVAACDWALVFDAEYYISEFPVLAYLYHHDKDLLLEHFQTVGVHEGRQGSAGFNVSAYADHCDPKVQQAFGDNWACYYFYWMLNQDTEFSIDASGDGYPTWHDAVYAIRLHDSIDGDDVTDCMRLIGVKHYGENTYKWHNFTANVKIMEYPYLAYRNSQAHYEGMINPEYVYVGMSNTYRSEQTEKTLAQFDLFTEYTPVTSR